MPITGAVSVCSHRELLREALADIAAQTYADWNATITDCPG